MRKAQTGEAAALCQEESLLMGRFRGSTAFVLAFALAPAMAGAALLTTGSAGAYPATRLVASEGLSGSGVVEAAQDRTWLSWGDSAGDALREVSAQAEPESTPVMTEPVSGRFKLSDLSHAAREKTRPANSESLSLFAFGLMLVAFAWVPAWRAARRKTTVECNA